LQQPYKARLQEKLKALERIIKSYDFEKALKELDSLMQKLHISFSQKQAEIMKKNILIVDDAPENIELLAQLAGRFRLNEICNKPLYAFYKIIYIGLVIFSPFTMSSLIS